MAIEINLEDEQDTITDNTMNISGFTAGGFVDHNYGAVPALTTADFCFFSTFLFQLAIAVSQFLQVVPFFF